MFFSTPKSVKEEIADTSCIPTATDKSLNDSYLDNQRRMAADLVTIDSIINLVRLQLYLIMQYLLMHIFQQIVIVNL